MKTAYFAAGCFWGIEKKFADLVGVINTAVGYMGGEKSNPTYEQVCSGETGHAEVVQVDYDSRLISYEKLLEHFWQIHNPTSLNFQGWDVGTQYRSVIFYVDEEQRCLAEKSRDAEGKSEKHTEPVVTEICKAERFWRAEAYHQQYLDKQKR